jgi:hypothetical protein
VEELFDLFDGFLKNKGFSPWAGQKPPEGQGRALDEEGWPLVFRLQEPYRRRPPAQIRAPLRGERRAMHDSQKFEDVLDTSNTASEVWADSAYRSDEIEESSLRAAWEVS